MGIVIAIMAVLMVGFVVGLSCWSKRATDTMNARHSRWMGEHPMYYQCSQCEDTQGHCDFCETLTK